MRPRWRGSPRTSPCDPRRMTPPTTGPTCGCRSWASRPGRERCSAGSAWFPSWGGRPVAPSRRRCCWSWPAGDPALRRWSRARCSSCSPRWRSPVSGSTRSRTTRSPSSRTSGAVVSVLGTVTSDPVLLTSGRTDQVMWRLRVTEVRGRGRVTSLATPVLVLTGADASRPALGATVRVGGRLAPADDDGLAALLLVHGEPEVVRGPSFWWGGAAAVRRSLRESVSHMPEAQRALVPALVVGDDSALPADVEADFRTTGLTHLLAVSGTNLTLVVGFLLALARWCRVRGRWLVVVGRRGSGRVRAPRPHRAQRAAGGRDGHRRPDRPRPRRTPAWPAGSRGRRAGAGAGRPGPGRDRRLRAVRAGHGRDPGAGAGHARRPGPVAAPLAGRGGGGAPGSTARVHAGRRRHLGPGEPRRGRDQRARRARGRTCDGAGPRRRVARAAVRGRRPGAPARLAAMCVAWIIEVAERGAALPAAAIGWGTGALPLAGPDRGGGRASRWRLPGCCVGRSPASAAAWSWWSPSWSGPATSAGRRRAG